MIRKILLFFLFLVCVIGGVIFFHEDGYSILVNKVNLVNQVFDKQVDSFSAMRDIHISNSTDALKLDEEISSYLDAILNNRLMIESILNRPYHFEVDKIEDDNYLQSSISLIHTQSSRLSKYVSSFRELLSNNNRNESKQYEEIINYLDIDDIYHYIDGISDTTFQMSSNVKILEFLNSSKDSWKYHDGNIEIIKRNTFNSYQEIEDSPLKSNISVSLIDDHTGPMIEARNVTIYLNQTLSLENQVYCYDEVDDEVSCQIEGSYDSSKVGEYPIVVRASDQSNNQSETTFVVKVIKKVNQKPYSIDVIRNQNIVIVYGLDDDGDYSRILKVFTCSTGSNNGTPTGNYSTSKGAVWGALYGGVWGQYTTRIVGSILFHSVPYYTKDKGNLEWEEYNKLGSSVSMGCVRLTVRDAKWIYYNVPVGTSVHIYDGEIPSGISKPSTPRIDGSSSNRGWDPTDDDPANPW